MSGIHSLDRAAALRRARGLHDELLRVASAPSYSIRYVADDHGLGREVDTLCTVRPVAPGRTHSPTG